MALSAGGSGIQSLVLTFMKLSLVDDTIKKVLAQMVWLSWFEYHLVH